MRILYVTTISNTMDFFKGHFEMLLKEGHTVELACNCKEYIPSFCEEMGLVMHDIPFSRSPISKANFRAIKQFKKLLKSEKFDIVHTHTPNASVCARWACRKLRKKGLKVFYTAHGFHFYKGSPRKNWLIYYTIEKICAKWTDALITMNQEDYTFAKKRLKAKSVRYMPGVGIDVARFTSDHADKERLKREFSVPKECPLLLSVGELNENKNHETVIRAIADKNVYYFIAGEGEKRAALQALIDEKGLSERVRLLGLQSNIKKFYDMADVFVISSYREGLPVALMEAMAEGLPCIVSRIRGNVDLIDDNGGVLFNPKDVAACSEAIDEILQKDWAALGAYNVRKVQNFSTEKSIHDLKEIYCL